MFHLLLAIVSSSLIAIIMRLSSDKVSGNVSMLAVNYTVCALLGAAYAGFNLFVPEISGFPIAMGLGVLSGFFYLGGFMLFQSNTAKNGIVLSSIFMRLGLLVPIVISVLIFGEFPTWTQTLGFVIALLAIILLNLKKESSKKGINTGLIILLLVSGGADSMSKFFERLAPAALSDQYLFFTFTVALILCIFLILRKKERPGAMELLFGTLIGIPNFFSSKFLLGALAKLPAVVVFPSFSVATMLIVTLTGVAVFKERLSKVQWAALAAIIAALVLLNL